jgi:predicted aspartyl protease
VRFEYVPYAGNWLPLIPVVFKHGKKRLPAVGALVDTGATHTMLPMEIAPELGIAIDLADRIETQVAGGGQCFVYPSPVEIDYLIRDPGSHLECTCPADHVIDV